ncbi:hypothetical protein JW930_02705 [Candidatus Woesearchaeota archaeon]|nr:hypothetical protein [Candidatus Woesearchaeota archaeon]
MNKKGVFFTYMAVFLIILIVAVVSTKDKYRYREKSNAISARIKTINSFIGDFEKDLDRELFIGGYRALLSMNAYVRIIEGYVDDFDSIFTEIIVNGSMNGTSLDLMTQGAQGADITSWLTRTNEEANKLNINLDLSVKNIYVQHVTPWDVLVTLNTTVYIEDGQGLASWTFDRIYTREFSILGFEDPLYAVGTEDKVTNLINITPNSDFIDDATNDTAVLNEHLLNSYYINSTDAPSFLMRFTGNLSPSPYGIESMVNLEDLDAQGIPLLARSVVDYIYFGNATTTDKCNVTDMPDWFRIDDSSIDTYEVDRLTYNDC